MTNPNHIHKFQRFDIARKGNPPYYVMKCVLPRCNSYTPMKTKLSCPTLIGKIALCNKCGDQFELNKRSLIAAKPLCNDCMGGPKKEALKKANKLFESLDASTEEISDDVG